MTKDPVYVPEKPFFLSFLYGNTYSEFYTNLDKSKDANPSMFDNEGQLILATKSFKHKFKIEPSFGRSNLQYINLILMDFIPLDLSFKENLLNVSEKYVYIYTGENEAMNIGGMVVPTPEIVRVKDNLAKYTREYAANKFIQATETGSLYKTYKSIYYTRAINSRPSSEFFLSNDNNPSPQYLAKGDSVIKELIDLYKDKYGLFTIEENSYNFLNCLKYTLTDSEYAKSNSLGGNRFKPQQGIVDEIEYSLPCKSKTYKLNWTTNDLSVELFYCKEFFNEKYTIKEKGPFITSCSIKYIPKKYFEELENEKTKTGDNKDSINTVKIQKTKEII
jgi:hypothetical protein